MSTPLTHNEARQRGASLSVHRTHVELDLTDADRFTSITTVTFDATSPSTFIECEGDITSVILNGEPMGFGHHDGRRLPLEGLRATNELTIAASMPYARDGAGLHAHIDAADGERYLYAMSFLDAAPRWFACFDQPDLKARVSMRVTCPQEWIVLGNAPTETTAPGVWEMAPTRPISTYLVTVVAGPYATVSRVHDGVKIGLHARRSMTQELERSAEDVFAVTAQCIDGFGELFGSRLPFGDAYHQVFVPDLTAGAMENPACVTFREEYLYRGAVTRAQIESRASTIAHEMAHQWFGDLVTMRWWEDLWLNESFAEFLGHHIRRDRAARDPWVDFGITRKHWGMTADAGPATHPVAANETSDTVAALQNFDGISYAKGASLLRELVEQIGEERFVAGLRRYIERFAEQNASLEDLVQAWRETGAPGVDQWVTGWLRTPGLDRICASGDAVRRHPGADGSVRQHHVEVVSLDSAGAVRGSAQVHLCEEVTPIDLPTGLIVPDACDDAWAQVRPNRPPEQWPPMVAIQDLRTQVVLWNSLRSQVENAETSTQVALDVVLGHLAAENDALVFGVLAGWAVHELAGVFAPREVRMARRRRIAEELGAVLDRERPGTDRHLEVMRALILCTDDAGWLRGLVQDGEELAGIEVDQELRWKALESLMRLDPDLDLLQAETERDPSSSGVLRHATAWASCPLPRVKEQVFAMVTEPGDHPASRVAAAADGLFCVGQEELTDPLADRWAERIVRTPRFRQGWALSRIASRSFPLANASPALLNACRDAASGDLDEGLQRSFIDGIDLMEKALAHTVDPGHDVEWRMR